MRFKIRFIAVCSLLLGAFAPASSTNIGDDRRPLAPGRHLGLLADTGFQPTETPSLEGVPVEQVVITSDELAESFQAYADNETFRGIPTVVRTTSWIDANYTGADRSARIRTFLRDAYDSWGTIYAVLGGDVEHVPTRYVKWDEAFVPSDLYYECLDREWNEDGDELYGEPRAPGGSQNFVSDADWGPDDKLWAATNVGVAYLEMGEFTSFGLADGLPSEEVRAVDAAADSSVWILVLDAVALWNGADWSAWDSADGLPGSQMTSVCAVAVDDVWVGTNGGLAHYDGFGWTTWTTADGLPDDGITAIARDGSDVWIGTARGVARLRDDVFTVFDETNSGLLSNWVLSIAVEAPGVVWFGHDDNFFASGGLSRFDGAWTSDDLPAYGGLSVRDLLVAPSGELWAATPEGVFHRDAGGDELLDATDGLAGADVFSVSQASGGDLAVAGSDGLTTGVVGSWTVYDAENGLPAPAPDWDEVDLVSELVVGRIPATDAAEADVYLQKLFDYQHGVDASQADQAAFFGEVLFPDEDGKMYCEDARDVFPASFGKTELYESDGTQDVASCLAALDQGPGYVVHVAHGSYDVIGVGADLELLFNGHLDGIDSGNRLAFYVVYSCLSGAFDQDSSTEHLLFNPNGGAIATMANTRSNIAGVDADYNLSFWQRFFASPHGRPAVAHREAREERLAADPDAFAFQTWWRRTYISRSYLGSPTLSLWRGVPGALSVDHPTTLGAGRSNIPVTVTDAVGGQPVENALVCLSKGTEDYAYGRTDSTGVVIFDFRPESAGNLAIRVSAPDYLPFEGAAAVCDPLAPLPVAEGWQLGGGGRIARATDLSLSLGLRNAGTAAATGWSVQLSTSDPLVTVTSGVGTLPPLDAGETGWTTEFSLAIDSTLPDAAPIRLVLTGSGPVSFTEEWIVPARSAGLDLARLSLAGSEIRPEIENRGAVGTGLVTATLTLASGTGSVIDGTGSVADIPPGSSVVLTDGFEVSGPASTVFELTVTDSAGHVLTRLVDREAPQGVGAPRALPRDGGAVLTWDPSPAADLAGTRVFGRSAPGPWQEELGGSALPSARAEVDFAERSREFLILAVDESGNVTADSAFVLAHAAIPMLPGWPVRLGSVLGPASFAVADLDSDDSPEIIVGSMWESNAIHVFRADGTEWTDGDGDPGTSGIFGQADDRVLSPPLVADVDDDGAMEIFAGSYDGNLYGWRTDGPADSPPPALPGWPIYQDINGVRSAPAVADLDGDGDPEIVAVVNRGTVRAFHVDGTIVDGWPYAVALGGLGSSPVIHDFDEDGCDDVVFGATDSTVHIVRGDGTDLPGWPAPVGAKVQSSPVLVDADRDGDFEIFALDRDGYLWAFHHDDRDSTPGADPLAGFPVATAPTSGSPPSPAVADFDEDGLPEIVINGDGEVAILRMDGTPFPGTPIVTGATGMNSPVIADLDGDRSFDVLVGTFDFRLTAYAIDGSVLPGWPRTFTEKPRSTPYVADVDGDGDLDIALAADDAYVRVVDADGPAISGAAPWPGYQGPFHARGKYIHVPLGSSDVSGDPIRPAVISLLPAAPNPFRFGTTVRFTLPEARAVRIDVFDVTGRRVASPAVGSWPAGAHAVQWDGRDLSGLPVASGVYFMRLEAGSTRQSAKVLRIR